MKEISGASFDTFECGTATEMEIPGTRVETQYGSMGAYNVNIPVAVKLEEPGKTSVVGTQRGNNVAEGYPSWRDSCFAWLRKMKADYGPRFQAGTCGVPENIDRRKDEGYALYSSAGSFWLARQP